MRFIPLSEDELQVSSLVPEGIYAYQVVKSEDAISKAGNEYIKLMLKIWDHDGKENLVFTNLALIKLLKHFCDLNGMQAEYDSGNIPPSLCSGKSGGRVQIGIEEAKPRNDGTGAMYPAKNIVKDYIAAQQGSMSAPLAMKPLPDVKDDFSDSIPF